MDKKYWESYYKTTEIFEQSDFAEFVLRYIKPTESIIDLGCGTGRDSIYFANNSITTIAVDQSETAIDNLNNVCNDYLSTICVDLKDLDMSDITHAYSRFSLHSIEEDTENILLHNIKNNISDKFFIEVRSDKDKLVNQTTDHYRRFINFESLLTKLITFGFKINYAELSKGFSIYNTKFNVNYNELDPTLIRIVCTIPKKE